MLPYPVLYGPHKLARAHLSVHLCRRNKADLRPVRIHVWRGELSDDWLVREADELQS